MNIITVAAESSELLYPRKFYIDCPVDVEIFGSECRRIEIPRELALYIIRLKKENEMLKRELMAFFSSMKSKKELGQFIEIANREATYEQKAEKFLKLIRNK